MARIAIFGGTFDPIHIGHVAIADGIIERRLVERIVFMPAHIPPHKGGRTITDARVRLSMVEAAICDQPLYTASDFEIEKEATSYTIETLDHFHVLAPCDELSFIMGGDSADELTTWKNYERLVSDYSTIVVSRPGYDLASYRALIVRLGYSEVGPLRYVNRAGRSVTIIDDIRRDISATAIRELIAHGKDVSALIPPGALAIAHAQKLYL